jgi:AcrR family transcriptional regulator
MEAVLEAAADLFAERGPAATSIRDVAVRSGVNHGLVYRHFGTKEDLVAAVLDHVSDRFNRAFDEGRPGLEDAIDRQLRVLARALLDGYPVGRLQHRFPFVARLIDQARQATTDEREARLAAGNVVALELGWRLFAPFILAAAGLEGVDATERWRDVEDLAARLLRLG